MFNGKSKAFRAGAVGLAMVLPLALASCGGDGADEASGGDAVLRYGVDLTPMGGPQFDPINDSKSLVPNRNSWNDLIFDRLIHRAEDGTLQPGLLESWEVVDPLTLEVTVRDGVKFQDGTDLNAEALKFNWDRGMKDDTLAKPLDFQNVKDIVVVSDSVARINYTSPASAFTLNNTFVLSRGFGAIASPTALEKQGDTFNEAPVGGGAGPYEFDSYSPGQEVSLRKWDGYWNPDAQKLAGVDFIQTTRGAATVSALMSDRIDIGVISNSDVSTIEQRDGMTTLSKPGTEVLYLMVNLTRPPFDTLEARQALAYAIDRDGINQGAYGGTGEATDTLYYPSSPFYVEGLDVPYEYDPDKAASMLRDAGVEEGTTINTLVQAIPEMQAGAEVLQAQLKEVGINMKLNVTPNFVDEMLKKPDSLFASTINYNMAGAFLNKDGTYNLGYDSKAFEEATKTTLSAGDETELQEAYKVSQQALLDDVPIFFLVQEPITLGMSDDVEGVGEVRSDLEGPVLANVSLK